MRPLMWRWLKARHENARLLAARDRADGFSDAYFEEWGTGAGAMFGQQEAASNETAAAMMASLAIFMMVCQIGLLSLA